MQTASPHLTFVAQSSPGDAGAADLACADRDSSGEAVLRQLQEKLRQTDTEAQTSAAVLELLGKLESCRDLRHASITLVSELQSHLGCQQVALGVRRGRKPVCRLSAVSGMGEFDQHSELVRAMEAALGETLLRESRTVWPPANDSERHATLAHQRLSSLTNATSLVSAPLRNEQGEVVGVVLFVGIDPLECRPGVQAFLRACEATVGTCIDLFRRVDPGPVTRWCRTLLQQGKSRLGRAAIAAACLLGAGLAVPMPYRIGCRCQIQPVTRRFVVAPFDGRLEKSLVSPGDVVSQSQVLARLDGREIRWELAGLTAELNAAAKKRDSALASQTAAAAQIAKLDMERLELKIRLLQHRAEHLEVKSPIDGIVVSGDLEKAEGAPLTPGQTLFEIAPLNEMVVELAVPEDEIAYVREGLPVTVRLDAYPSRTWSGSIAKIHPRSEIRDDSSVFIAEFESDNHDDLLRPGMNGRARIVGPRRALAWNLFHKPAESLAAALGW